MVERRWRRMVGPGFVTMAALLAIGASAPPTQGARPWEPTACGGAGAARVDAAVTPAPRSLEEVGAAPWFRLDPALDARGSLVGQRLTVGINGARLDRILTLPPESFAAGPFGGLVLVGTDDGRVSRLSTIDVARACVSVVAESAAVVRRATIAPDGTTVFEHRVDRTTREDLGIWRRRLDGPGEALRVLDAIEPDARFGRTWTTELAWSLEGDRLTVQSCGASACRTRLLDVASGRSAAIADPSLGSLVGVTRDRLVAHHACRGLPCPLVSVDLATGQSTILESDGGSAALRGSADDPHVVMESFTSAGLRLRRSTLDGHEVLDLGPLTDDLRLLGDPGLSGLGLGLPGDWVVLAPEARLPDTTARRSAALRSTTDGTTVSLDEVIR